MAVGRARGAYGVGRLLYLSSLVSAALLLPAALLLERSFWPAGPAGIAAIAALGLLSHTGGQGLLAFALGHLSPTFSSLVIFLSAIAASALGWLVLGERLSATQIAGGVVILLGIYAARPRLPHPETVP
jgi:drug/metabolite transporter (DMT)-like permease